MPGTITGRVLNGSGQPVAGVAVAVVQSTVPHQDMAAITAGDGTFRLGGLRPGTYTLGAGPGGATARVELTGSTAQADIRVD